MAPKAPKPYFLLAEVATQDKINKLLGRAVPFTSDNPEDKNQPLKRPSEGYIFPVLPPEGPDLRQIDPNLYPEGVKAKQAKVLLRSAQGTDAEIAIKHMLALFHASERSNSREVATPGFRRITMDQAPHRIRKLLEHPEYADPIFQYFTDFPQGKLGIIVSIICAMDMNLTVEQGVTRETGAQVEVPVSEALGIPADIIEAKAKLASTSSKLAETEGTYVGEVVVAVGYLQMTRKTQSGLMSWFRSKKPSLDDIELTSDTEYVNPKTMTVSLPATRIPGDQEAILGPGVPGAESSPAELRREGSAASTLSVDEVDSDDDIELYA